MKKFLVKLSEYSVYIALSFIVITAVGLLMGDPEVHALPEYVNRTGEPCSTCHVNPGGGGPRTLRGLLWAAQGRPEKVPQLENILLAPGVEDGVELYDIACASCHGLSGEGLFGLKLAGSGIGENQMRDVILRGRVRSGMPSFENKFTDEQLNILVKYVSGIATGVLKPEPESYPLPPAILTCVNNPEFIRCGGN
jgi:cytochrome c5